jgi:hypothetical protein
MPRLDAHGRVDQLVRQDRGDLRRHGVGRVGQVRPDEDFKVASALRRLSQHSPIARLLRPALVKPIATLTRSGRGAPNVSNSGAMPAATPFSQLSRLSWIISLSPFLSPAGR